MNTFAVSYVTPIKDIYLSRDNSTASSRLAADPQKLSLKQLKLMLSDFDEDQLEMDMTSLFQPAKLDVRLDFENLYIGLKRMGWKPDAKILSEAIKEALSDLGEINSITAYADWYLLDSENGKDMQRELALNDIEPRYQVSIHNKNSADMKIAGDIRSLLERDRLELDTVDIFVLGSGDRDFRTVVKEARKRGKHVIIIALKNSLSRMLRDVASEVRYLDDYLDLPNLRRTQNK